MYVHIGNNYFVNPKDIIAFLDISALEKQNSLENICKNLKISDNIIDISEGNKKTLILINKENQTIGYISNILSTTLGKRAAKYIVVK